jgi:hypothetical protein
VSDKALYVSPTRGQLGNALKALYGAVYVLSGGQGLVAIEANGVRHTVSVTLDQLRGEPKVDYCRHDAGDADGTKVIIEMARVASYLAEADFPELYRERIPPAVCLPEAYAAANPHASFTCTDQDGTRSWPATAPTWKRWTQGRAPSA